jgi:predicted lysophospholipase L1 biosynthesis ABC-type transport system permease subunit
MRAFRAWLLRLAATFRKGPRDTELSEELEGHLQLHIEDNLRRGMNPQEARREALMKLGGVAQTAASYRERRGVPVVDRLRMALGASPRDVLHLVLRQALLLAVVGSAVGLACAAAVTQLLTSMLFGVKATDPLTYVAVVIMLMGVAMLASYIPARRAMRVDPIVALRYE